MDPGLLPFTGVAPSDVDFSKLEFQALAGALVALICCIAFSTLRRSLLQTPAERVVESEPDPLRREKLRGLMERVRSLSTSASMFETASSALFATLVVRWLLKSRQVTWDVTLGSLAITVPSLWLATQALAPALAASWGERIVRGALPVFHRIQWPIAFLAMGLDGVRHGMMRLFGHHTDLAESREMVAGLREVVADTEASGPLDATERELIGNIMEVREVDVAAVMTPRTSIQALEVDTPLLEAARIASESGYSRLPVFEGKLDIVVGTVSARDLMSALVDANGKERSLRSLLRPAYFVPETKLVAQLLKEFRREKIKLAVVLDEYGGTAGMVTLGDVLGEIVGEIRDESDEESPSPLKHLPGGVVEIDAALHVSEVNELVDLDLPETAGYETLGGFVLAEFGRFPQRGESFMRGATEFQVSEVTDRRVLKVRVRKLAA
ncbi:MAG TPA: hemolysin family protein [Planctomycetota bacterium]|nr:hemolysin family protein [Planctomycetota bacterium]